MKKKILIVFTAAMELGGIERSLLGLLDAIDYETYEVDLFLYAHHGPLFPLLNSSVHLLPEVKELAYLRESFGEKIRHACFYSAALRFRDAVMSKLKPIDFDRTWAQVMRKRAPQLDKEYDIALGFFRPFDYLMEKVTAGTKVGWIHTDYSSIDDIDVTSLRRDYEPLDKIIAVSEQCRNSFTMVLPELKQKTDVIENILSKTFIEKQASAEAAIGMPEDGSIKLLTVGRYSDPKRQDEIPAICKRLIAFGLDVKWYLIGFGPMEPLIRQKIDETGMQQNVILLGKKENPYPYIKACDLYVQPSRYEGKCVAVREAQILHKPVVITNYATSASQLADGEDGVIVPMDIEGCAAGIAALLRDKDKLEKIVQGTFKTDYTNAAEIEKIYQMME